MADYSKKFKRRVVILWIRHNMSSSEISRLSGIDHKTLLKWYKRFYPEIAVGGGWYINTKIRIGTISVCVPVITNKGDTKNEQL